MNTALINAAEQFRAAYKDGNAATLLDYFDNIFRDALASPRAEPAKGMKLLTEEEQNNLVRLWRRSGGCLTDMTQRDFAKKNGLQIEGEEPHG